MEGADVGDENIRIACLLPSCTEICMALGLGPKIVAATHECRIPSSLASSISIVTSSLLDESLNQADIDAAIRKTANSSIQGTSCSLPSLKISNNNSSSSSSSSKKVEENAEENMTEEIPPSLYPLNGKALCQSNPTIILTQDLCSVCAPSTSTVQMALADHTTNQKQQQQLRRVVSISPGCLSDVADTLVSIANACQVPKEGERLRKKFLLELSTLRQTVQSTLQQQHQENRQPPSVLVLEWLDPPYDAGHWIPDLIEMAGCRCAHISPIPPQTSHNNHSTNHDNDTTQRTKKSLRVSWEAIQQLDPDVILVASCGFHLKRNLTDAISHFSHNSNNNNNNTIIQSLRAVQNHRVYAVDADSYFVKPCHALSAGATIIAQCAFYHPHSSPPLTDDLKAHHAVCQAVAALPFAPAKGVGWDIVPLSTNPINQNTNTNTGQSEVHEKGEQRTNAHKVGPPSHQVLQPRDIEDLMSSSASPLAPSSTHNNPNQNDDFLHLHRMACDAGKLFYRDPKSGYHVFTELAHKQRGKCCGSGCRHCPYNHENMSPNKRASKIMQPAFLHFGSTLSFFLDHNHQFKEEEEEEGMACMKDINVKVLFFSGGKDSFLTIRAFMKQQQQQQSERNNPKTILVLLTTFDAKSRIIAHQEISIDDILRQAMHLDLPLIGVPVHRQSSETYVERIERALNVIVTTIDNKTTKDNDDKTSQRRAIRISSLVFGDLHLDHIRSWRESELGHISINNNNNNNNNATLEFPIWNVPYEQLLLDLEQSGVECILSSSTREFCSKGDVFHRQFYEQMIQCGIDAFGENGDFHTIVKVWVVSREQALGIS